MRNELFERFVQTQEAIVSELTHIRMLLEQNVVISEKKKRNAVNHVPSFDDFLTYYNLLPSKSFHNQPFDVMYQMYLKYCPLGGYEPISPNRFSRLVHKLGYISETRKHNKVTKKIFVKNNS